VKSGQPERIAAVGNKLCDTRFEALRVAAEDFRRRYRQRRIEEDLGRPA
jgi:hypothetical protein